MGVFSKSKDPVSKVDALSKNKSKEEQRIIEQKLLKPTALPDYSGKKPTHKSELHSRTALIVFKSKEHKKLIGSLFNIRTSMQGETYITDISLLDWLAKQVQKGKYVVKNGRLVPIKKLKRKKARKK